MSYSLFQLNLSFNWAWAVDASNVKASAAAISPSLFIMSLPNSC